MTNDEDVERARVRLTAAVAAHRQDVAEYEKAKADLAAAEKQMYASSEVLNRARQSLVDYAEAGA